MFWLNCFARIVGPPASRRHKPIATEIMVSVLGKVEIAASLALAGGCAVSAVLERIVRKRTIKRLTERTQKLEKAIDPRRSSSGLTPTGSTHPRDKDK